MIDRSVMINSKPKNRFKAVTLRSRPYIIKNTMLRQQSINSRRANGFVLIVLEAMEFFKICASFAKLESSTHSFKCLAAVYAPDSSLSALSCRCGYRYQWPRLGYLRVAL
jgi:hypothetical protein